MLVAELHQVLMEHEISCHCTCFSFQLGGIALDSLTELRSIQSIQDGALIKVVEGNCLILLLFFTSYSHWSSDFRLKAAAKPELGREVAGWFLLRSELKGFPGKEKLKRNSQYSR